MRKCVSFLLALVLCAAALCVGSFAGSGDAAIDGVSARAAFSLADGVDFAAFALDDASRFGTARFSVVSFDASRDDLLLSVIADGETFDSDRKAIVSVKADFGGEALFSLTDGAIAASRGGALAFGVSAAGEAMIGDIAVSATLVDRDAARSVTVDAINRDGGEITVFTADSSAEPSADSYRVAVDFAQDVLLVPGVPAAGVVTAIAACGETLDASAGATVISAKGEALDGFAVGDRVMLTAEVADSFGNTAAWRTVKNSVFAAALLVRDGAAQTFDGDEIVPATVIGLRPDGSTAIISLIGEDTACAAKLAALCEKFGIVDAAAVDADGALVVSSPRGADEKLPELPDASDLASQLDSPLRFLRGMKLERPKDTPEALAVKNAGHGAAQPDAAQSAGAAQSVGDSYEPVNALYKQIEFDSTGEWLTLVINESDVEAWYGKIF